MFIVGGALPALYIAYLGIRHTVKRVTLEEPEDILFTEVDQPAGVPSMADDEADGGEAHMSPEALLAAGYAGFLLVVAAVAIEWLSAHTHRRSLRYRTAGFTYDADHDHWECPEGQHLWPHEFDAERRLVRYRAKAHICNGCPRKDACTDSDHGREIVRPLDPWPHSEAGRFHRGLSLMLVALSLLVLVAVGARHHDAGRGGAAARAAGAAPSRPAAGCCATSARIPANFPDPTAAHGLRMAATDAGGRRTPSRWASQNRTEGDR